MTKERSSSNTRRPIDTSLSNSFSSGVSSLSSSNYGVRTVRVFKNGDPYHQGTKFVVNRRYVHDLDHMLNLLSEKIDLPYGAKRLFTTNGKLVRHLNDIEDKQTSASTTSEKNRETWLVPNLASERPVKTDRLTGNPERKRFCP
ncbi:Doublecortin [Ostertagia ostertagi]